MKNLNNIGSWCFILICFSISSCGPYKMKNKTIKQDTTAFGSPVILKSSDSLQNVYQSCVVNEMHWAPGNIESILIDPGPEFIFPGNVMDAASLQDGKYINIAGDRKPITLVINSTAFNKPTWTVDEPSASTITKAIDTMLRSGTTGNVAADVQFNAHEVYSEDHLQLLMQAKYSGGFGSVEAGFNFKNSSVISRYLLDVVQVYYTIFMETPKDGFFEKQPKSLTDSSVPAPVYVSSVKYGRRVMIAVESEENNDERDAYLRAKMNGMAASGSLDVNLFSTEFFTNKSVKVMVKGGDADNAYRVFKAVTKKEDLFNILDSSAHWSMNSLGVPLSYQVKNTSDNSNFYVSQAGNYKARICTVKTQNDTTANVPLFTSMCLWHSGGGDRNFGGDPFANFNINLFVDPNNRNIIRAKIEVRMEEDGGDHTSGTYLENKAIITLPDNYEVTEITSPTTMLQPTVKLPSQRKEFPGDQKQYPVQSIVLIGDSPDNNDDDLFPGACSPNHAAIESLQFYPVSFRFTKKVK